LKKPMLSVLHRHQYKVPAQTQDTIPTQETGGAETKQPF